MNLEIQNTVCNIIVSILGITSKHHFRCVLKRKILKSTQRRIWSSISVHCFLLRFWFINLVGMLCSSIAIDRIFSNKQSLFFCFAEIYCTDITQPGRYLKYVLTCQSLSLCPIPIFNNRPAICNSKHLQLCT